MDTRVERHSYNDEELGNVGRTKKNASLYKQDYSDEEIVIPKIYNGRELNEVEFQKLINQSETRSMKVITDEDVQEYDDNIKKKNDKVYDINSVLEKAKIRRKAVDAKQYKVPVFEEYVPVVDEESEEDIDLMSELMGSDDTVVDSITSKDTYDIDFDNTRIDESFYSKSLKFDKSDFMNNNNVKKKTSKLHIIITVIIVVLLIVAVVLGILILSKFKF